MELYLQVCDIIHHSPAFNRMPLSVDEVVIDLKDTRGHINRERIQLNCKHITINSDGVLTLWKTNDVDLVMASAAISQ